MADASLALAERRPDDLKKATERLGVEGPTTKQLRGLRLMGLVAPPSSAGALARVRGIVLLILLIAVVFGIGFGIITGIAAAAGGLSTGVKFFYDIVLILIVVGVFAYLGRRRQKRMKAERAEQIAARSR
jgi:uncharacterized membrane protein